MSLPTQLQSQLEDCYEDFILQGYTEEEAAEMVEELWQSWRED